MAKIAKSVGISKTQRDREGVIEKNGVEMTYGLETENVWQGSGSELSMDEKVHSPLVRFAAYC